MPPQNIDTLYFISIRIKDDDTGHSCNDLINLIIQMLNEQNLIDLFKNKIEVRGSKYCLNQTNKFSYLDSKKYNIYNSDSIELPIIPKGVYEMEWKQSFDFVNESDYDKSIGHIINYLKLGL